MSNPTNAVQMFQTDIEMIAALKTSGYTEKELEVLAYVLEWKGIGLGIKETEYGTKEIYCSDMTVSNPKDDVTWTKVTVRDLIEKYCTPEILDALELN